MPSAAERAYVEIREAVTGGRYLAGDRLREEELSTVIGVSRTPIREALRRLTAEGLVELLPHRGAHVASWTDAELTEIFEFRALIESFGARRAAAEMPSETIEKMAQLATAMETTAEQETEEATETVAELNNEFHHIIADHAGEYLLAFFSKLVQIPLVHRTFRRYTPHQLRRSFQHHHELVDAFRARDPRWAEAVMTSHILAARHIFAGDGK